MSRQVQTLFGCASILAPVICFLIDSHTLVYEDDARVDYFALPHLALIHYLILLAGTGAGIFAGLGRSRLWYCAAGANLVVLALYAIGGSRF